MNKLLLIAGLLVALVAVTANAQKNGVLSKICEKCEYCKTDQNCDGCAMCSECTSRSQVALLCFPGS